MLKLLCISLLLPLVLTSCTNIKSLDQNSAVKRNGQSQVIKTEITPTPIIIAEAKPALPLKAKTLTHENTDKVNKYCNKIQRTFKKFNWGKSHCEDYSWNHVRSSHLGNPIIWFVYGDDKDESYEKVIQAKNTTLILCGVHGDEITPIKFCFDILEDIKKNPKLIKNNKIVIAPIVSPDSFFKKSPTRTNARGVDVNRNFPTKDWNKSALRLWRSKYKKNKRRYPGKHALSEQETIFQVNLIKLYQPQKVISIHAPLTLLDYDGPSFDHASGVAAKQLLLQMSEKSGKYRVSNYPHYPGSLGNYAGVERSIPTYTLELPNSDWNKTKRYFRMFRSAIQHAINHDLTVKHINEEKVTKNENEKEHKAN